MFSFLQYLELSVYLFSFVLILISYYLLIVSTQSYLPIKLLRHSSLVFRVNEIIKTQLHNESSEKLFKEAGLPIKLTGFSFTLFRLILISAAICLIVLKWLWGNYPFPTSSVGMIFVAFLLTSTRNQMPLSYLLKKMKQFHTINKNKECFLLYSMLLNEFFMEDEKPYNTYSILLKFSNYFDKIKPALLKSLSAWKRNPQQALDIFAAEIGTDEARDLAQILKSIDASNAVQARDIIKSRYEQFQTSRHEQHRRKLKNIDLCGYIAVFIPTIAILFNMVFVLGIAVQGLLQRINYH